MLVACTVWGVAVGSAPPAGSRGNDLFVPCASQEGSPQYARYDLGPSFKGLPLTGATYTCMPEHSPVGPSRTHVSTYLYGDCSASESGCGFPVEVQNYPVCDRNRSSYSSDHRGNPVAYTMRRIRGVPVAQMNDRLEVYTGTSTVVLFGSHLREAAGALRSVRDGSPVVEAGAPLAPPVAGHLYGAVECGYPTPRARILHVRGGLRLIVRLPTAAVLDVVIERRMRRGTFRSRFAPPSPYKPIMAIQVFKKRGRAVMDAAVPVGRFRVWVVAADSRGRRSNPQSLRLALNNRVRRSGGVSPGRHLVGLAG